MLSDDQIQKFKELYKKHYGVELDQNQAFERALRLISLIETVYKPAVDIKHDDKLQRDNNQN